MTDAALTADHAIYDQWVKNDTISSFYNMQVLDVPPITTSTTPMMIDSC